MIGFGVDIGGSGVKAAPVDLDTGLLADDRARVDTPQPATPEAVVAEVAQLVAGFGWEGRLGVTVPGVVQHGVVRTAANIDPSWKGLDLAALLRDAHGLDAVVLNDADAAGVAEMTHGAGKGRDGVVLVATLGTGIGTALFTDGHLVPNTELGHIELHGGDAEKYAAAKVRKAADLEWTTWAGRLDEYLDALEKLLWPDLIILGGGVSRKAHKWIDVLTVEAEVVPAQLQNTAGIVGAAMAAAG